MFGLQEEVTRSLPHPLFVSSRWTSPVVQTRRMPSRLRRGPHHHPHRYRILRDQESWPASSLLWFDLAWITLDSEYSATVLPVRLKSLHVNGAEVSPGGTSACIGISKRGDQFCRCDSEAGTGSQNSPGEPWATARWRQAVRRYQAKAPCRPARGLGFLGGLEVQLSGSHAADQPGKLLLCQGEVSDVRILAVTNTYYRTQVGQFNAVLAAGAPTTASATLPPDGHEYLSKASASRSREVSHGRALAPIRSQRVPNSRTSVSAWISFPSITGPQRPGDNHSAGALAGSWRTWPRLDLIAVSWAPQVWAADRDLLMTMLTHESDTTSISCFITPQYCQVSTDSLSCSRQEADQSWRAAGPGGERLEIGSDGAGSGRWHARMRCACSTSFWVWIEWIASSIGRANWVEPCARSPTGPSGGCRAGRPVRDGCSRSWRTRLLASGGG